METIQSDQMTLFEATKNQAIQVKSNGKIKLYENQIQLTSQFRFCGNAFRIDTYRGCSFGCKYCFANNRMGRGFDGQVNYQIGRHEVIERLFRKINDGEHHQDINVELLRKKVP
ncbi:unnamed protein product, partial [marine sediment metagenome]